jgi:hypothetical protein
VVSPATSTCIETLISNAEQIGTCTLPASYLLHLLKRAEDVKLFNFTLMGCSHSCVSAAAPYPLVITDAGEIPGPARLVKASPSRRCFAMMSEVSTLVLFHFQANSRRPSRGKEEGDETFDYGDATSSGRFKPVQRVVILSDRHSGSTGNSSSGGGVLVPSLSSSFQELGESILPEWSGCLGLCRALQSLLSRIAVGL